MKKRILSLLLAIVMVLGMLPVFAMAEEAATPESVMIDFIAFAQDAATQDFWADLRTHIGNQGGSKSVGTLGTEMTETEIAAYKAMLAYMEENYCWSIDDANSHITTPSAYQVVLFNDNQTAGNTTTRAAGWGLAYQSGGFDTGRGVNRPSELNLTVNVKEAGYYKVYTDAYYSAANGNLIQQTGLANSYIGCGYADVLVNGVPVVEKYAFSAYTDSPHYEWAQKTMNDQLGYAYLQEGDNTITINTVADYLNGTTKAGRWVMLDSMELEFVDGDCHEDHENPTHIAYTSNENGTHNTACKACGVAFEENVTCVGGEPVTEGHVTYAKCACGYETSRVVEDCYDNNTDGKCDLCGGEVEIPCEHLSKTESEPVFNAETKQHTITITCEDCDEYKEEKTEECTSDDGTFDGKHTTTYKCSVCEGVLSVETTECTDTKTSCVNNNNGTHMVTVTCNTCGEIVSEEIADCTDFSDETVEHTTTYTCNDCGYFYSEEDSICEESEQTTTYEVAEGAYHTVIVTCNVCGETVSTESVECTPDEKVVDGHHETISCIYCKDLIEEGYTGCVDEDHDQACDICGEPVECLHDGEKTTETATNDDQTHTITETCDWCKNVISTKTESCTDADHNQVCDVEDCGGEVACLHDGDNNTYYPQEDGTHNFRCEYCNELIKGEAHTFEKNDFICDKCDYNVAVAEIDGEYYTTLAEAIATAEAEATVKLLKNTNELVTINKSLTLDLGNKTLNGQVRVTAGAVVIENGTVYVNENGVDAIILGTKNQIEEEMTLTLNSISAVSNTDCAVVLYDGTLTLNNGAALISYSAEYAVLQGSGNDFGNADIYGAVVNEGNDLAIYWPQDGELNILDGSYIEGTTAVYAKGGKVNISGGTLKATGDAADFDPSNNGGYATGDALVVEYAGGDYGIVEVSVTGGTFTSENAKAVAAYTRNAGEEVEPFVEGGIFSTDVTEFCVDGYACVANVNGTFTPAKIEMIDSQASMTLGNELVLNIVFDSAEVDAFGRDDLKAYVTHTHEVTGVTTEYEIDLEEYGNGKYWKAAFGVAAKQMADEVSVELRDAYGNVYSKGTESVSAYAMREINRLLALETMTAKEEAEVTLLVDMLNYGAAAQEFFSYNEEDLANNELTDEMQAYATEPVDCVDNRTKSETCYGSYLTLEDRLWLKTVFNGSFTQEDIDNGIVTAKVSFNKGLDGELVEADGIIELYGAYGRISVTTDKLVVADGAQLVTMTVYVNGEEYGTVTDSIEGYVARGTDEAIYGNIMKFVTSAREYLSI